MLNFIKVFAGTDDMFEATIGLVKAIFQTQGIDPKLREMIILRAATILNAPYEWQASAQMAKNAGELNRCCSCGNALRRPWSSNCQSVLASIEATFRA